MSITRSLHRLTVVRALRDARSLPTHFVPPCTAPLLALLALPLPRARRPVHASHLRASSSAGTQAGSSPSALGERSERGLPFPGLVKAKP